MLRAHCMEIFYFFKIQAIMKIILNILLAAALAILAGCSEGESNASSKNEETMNTPAVNEAPAPVQAPAEMQPATTSTTATGAVNPAHGEPGHRCDIAVGAPMNSAPASAPVEATPQPVNPAPQPAVNQPVQMPVNPAPAASTGRVNPAHGQPGHDCKIAVGAPLN